MEIIFTNCFNTEDIFPPEPAFKSIPEWYKNTESYDNNVKKPDGNGRTTASIKKCMPVFDAITSGYIIRSQVDLYISQKEIYAKNLETGEDILIGKQPWYEWANLEAINFHPMSQAPEHPNRNGHLEFPKWMSPWGIKTPKGYSCLIVNPLHRTSDFTILTGIVDTDKYDAPINFPFVLNDINFEGLIPAGTPIAQIIPFKRDSWKMKFGNKKDILSIQKTEMKVKNVFFDGYKNYFRTSKDYK